MSDVKVVRGISEESEDGEDIFASNFGASTTVNKVKIVGSDSHFEQQAAAIEAAKRGDTINILVYLPRILYQTRLLLLF